MIDINIRTINGERQYQDLVGLNGAVNGIGVSLESWDKEYGELLIVIDGNSNGMYKSDEKISLAFGEKAFVDRLRMIYGFNIIFIESFQWSEATDRTMRALQYSGFTNVIANGSGEIAIANDSGVSIPATFLTEEERRYILTPPKGRAFPANAEKVIPIKNIYLK